MKMNVFEGARRIALLVGGLWAIGCVSYAIFTSPYTSVDYVVPALGATAVLVDACADSSAREYIHKTTPDGDNISVNLCFATQKADNGEMLVPYAPAEGNKVWLGSKYSSEVSAYTKAVGKVFQLDKRGLQDAKAKKRSALFEQWKDAIQVLFVGLLIGWFFVIAAGWIVRGFMGIPDGQDARRPD